MGATVNLFRFKLIIKERLGKITHYLFFVDPGKSVEVVLDNTVEKFRCVLCGKIFSDKSNCRKHIKVLHFGVKEPQDPCPLCSKPILRKNMSAHVKNNCPYRQPR